MRIRLPVSCVFPFQLESGGDMAHVKDLTAQAVRFGLFFSQVLTPGPEQGEELCPPCLVKDLGTITSYLW